MILSDGDRRQGFGHWLRTGRLPSARSTDGVEVKFNPWHDPDDGRFTFVGSGRYHGGGGGRSPGRTGNRSTAGVAKASRENASRPATANGTRTAPRRFAEFIRGTGEGAHDAAREVVGGVHAALTTDPRTTALEVARGLARTIDAAISAEDTPARVQVAKAIQAARTASARDVGRSIGTVARNTALAIAPGAAVAKVSAVRLARRIGPRTEYRPPDIYRRKENLGGDPQAPARRL